MTQPVVPVQPDSAPVPAQSSAALVAGPAGGPSAEAPRPARPPGAARLSGTARPGHSTGRAVLPLQVADLSAFARSLRQLWQTHQQTQSGVPGHVQMLNMLARAAGHRNVQSLKAQVAAERVAAARQALTIAASRRPDLEGFEAAGPDIGPAVAATTPVVLTANAAKALTQFDDWGRLTRWPHKFSVQRLAMWALWTRFDGARRYSEREVNEILKAWTIYGDHVTPRRELIEMKLLGREADCSVYWKERQRPDEEVRALLQALRARRPG
jgi:hypothetical protein